MSAIIQFLLFPGFLFTASAGLLASWFDRNVIDFIVNLVGSMGKAAAWVVGLFDNGVIDGAVNGTAWTSQTMGALLGRLQTGRVRSYLFALAVGVVAVAAMALLAVVL